MSTTTIMSTEILIPFAGALQASLSVLLVIFYGVLIAQYGLLFQKASRDVSVLCVRLFLPALLLANIGATVTRDTFPRYIPVFGWYNRFAPGHLQQRLIGSYCGRPSTTLRPLHLVFLQLVSSASPALLPRPWLSTTRQACKRDLEGIREPDQNKAGMC